MTLLRQDLLPVRAVTSLSLSSHSRPMADIPSSSSTANLDMVSNTSPNLPHRRSMCA